MAPKLGVSWRTARQWMQVACRGRGAFLSVCRWTWESKMHTFAVKTKSFAMLMSSDKPRRLFRVGTGHETLVNDSVH
ncbi:hypothetical protein [Arcanobacterium phocae]|uniref:hypothetical protein n=1 Tax=Arcanobacterium phocae TaxID=131112 RepID=UPI001C0EA6CC|nr:hypothetical protein [Arcanobacterium phocae]